MNVVEHLVIEKFLGLGGWRGIPGKTLEIGFDGGYVNLADFVFCLDLLWSGTGLSADTLVELYFLVVFGKYTY